MIALQKIFHLNNAIVVKNKKKKRTKKERKEEGGDKCEDDNEIYGMEGSGRKGIDRKRKKEFKVVRLSTQIFC